MDTLGHDHSRRSPGINIAVIDRGKTATDTQREGEWCGLWAIIIIIIAISKESHKVAALLPLCNKITMNQLQVITQTNEAPSTF